MAKDKTYVGDQYKVFQLTVWRSDTDAALDISDAATTTSRLVYYEKPDGSLASGTSVFVNNGTDGALYLTTPSGLFDTLDGEYKLQLKLTKTNGQIFHTSVYSFDVLPNIYA